MSEHSTPTQHTVPIPVGTAHTHNIYQQPIPADGPDTQPDGPRSYTYVLPPGQMATHSFTAELRAHPTADASVMNANPSSVPPGYAPLSAELYAQAQAQHAASQSSGQPGPSSGAGANHYPSASGVPRLPPILQVEKQQVTTSATQLASASRRRNEANFACPVPGCGSTFTRRFNLRGHLRSHTEERPYVCEWPGCKKGFARQHDCKRHQALHAAKSQANVCRGCKKTFSRLDALNRHLRSEGGADCRVAQAAEQQSRASEPAVANREIEPV